jgi:hypothetical protein
MEVGRIEQLTTNTLNGELILQKLASQTKEKKKENNKMNPEFINYFSEALIGSSELNYPLELHGEPGYQYVIGCDFGLITTNITISKIESTGIKIVRNITPQGLTISEQSLLVKQLWKDYNKALAISMDLDKLGAAIYDCLSTSDIDPRDGELLPPFVNININKEDYNEIPNAIKVIKFIQFSNLSNTQFMVLKMKRGLEDNVVHFPHPFYCNEDIIQLKQEICNIKVKADNNGSAVKFVRNNEDQLNQVNRFTSALFSINEALNHFNKKQ